MQYTSNFFELILVVLGAHKAQTDERSVEYVAHCLGCSAELASDIWSWFKTHNHWSDPIGTPARIRAMIRADQYGDRGLSLTDGAKAIDKQLEEFEKEMCRPCPSEARGYACKDRFDSSHCMSYRHFIPHNIEPELLDGKLLCCSAKGSCEYEEHEIHKRNFTHSETSIYVRLPYVITGNSIVNNAPFCTVFHVVN